MIATRGHNKACPQSRSIHAANAFALDSCGVLLEDQLIGPSSFASLRGGVGSTSRCAAECRRPTCLTNRHHDPADVTQIFGHIKFRHKVAEFIKDHLTR